MNSVDLDGTVYPIDHVEGLGQIEETRAPLSYTMVESNRIVLKPDILVETEGYYGRLRTAHAPRTNAMTAIPQSP